MELRDAKRHAEHLCDVFPADDTDEHCGVIERFRTRKGVREALVGGHPAYPDRWIPVSALATVCTIRD